MKIFGLMDFFITLKEKAIKLATIFVRATPIMEVPLRE